MKKLVSLLYFLGVLLLLASCSHPSWHQTGEGTYIYCIAKDKYKLRWTGDVVGSLANGNGQLIAYTEDGEIKESQALSTKYGVSNQWTYLPCKDFSYLGELKKGQPHGFGVMIYKDTILIGNFKKSCLYKGFCEKYLIKEVPYQCAQVIPLFSGVYKKGRVNGVAKFYKDGELVFEGTMRKGLRHGVGKEYENGVLVYNGYYKKGLRNGYGQAYKHGQIWYDGTWKNGKRDGEGKLYNESGFMVYDGDWDEDLYDGRGKLYENGIVIEGKWDEGSLVKSISTSTFEQISHATKIWLGREDTTQVESAEEEPVTALMATNQIEFVEMLQQDIETEVRTQFEKRVDKRFGFWHLIRMWFQPWATSDVRRAKSAEKYFCKKIDAKDMQQFINTKVDYYNKTVEADEQLNYVKLQAISKGEIVTTDTALKIFDREAIETTDTLAGILIDILVCFVVAFVIGFIIGCFIPVLIPYAGIVDIVLGLVAIGIGLWVSVFRTSSVCIELEQQILDMLTNNYMQYIDSQNIISQLLGLL